MSLKGKICLVTGASRGIGRGIALQLGEAGATVYITGRTLSPSGGEFGSLGQTAREIVERGGKCIPLQCDHANDKDVEKLFETISKEQDGRLDLLVNNAYAAVKMISENRGKPFWEQPMNMWDTVNNVGLRNHYMCTIYAARIMVPRKSGLIVNISSGGGLKYLFNVPYGVGKEACDRMAADCAVELRQHNVAMVSVWPGPVRTEKIEQLSQLGVLDSDKDKKDGIDFSAGETTEYVGKAIVHLYSDKYLHQKSGKVLLTTDLAYEYGFKDIDGRQPPSIRQLSFLLGRNPKTAWAGKWTPGFVYIPKWIFSLGGNKF